MRKRLYITKVKENAGFEEFLLFSSKYQRECPQFMDISKLLEIY